MNQQSFCSMMFPNPDFFGAILFTFDKLVSHCMFILARGIGSKDIGHEYMRDQKK